MSHSSSNTKDPVSGAGNGGQVKAQGGASNQYPHAQQHHLPQPKLVASSSNNDDLLSEDDLSAMDTFPLIVHTVKPKTPTTSSSQQQQESSGSQGISRYVNLFLLFT